jgi:hypothetical protein
MAENTWNPELHDLGVSSGWLGEVGGGVLCGSFGRY